MAMEFLIIVKSCNHATFNTALNFINQAIVMEHKVSAIFFQHAGIYHCLKQDNNLSKIASNQKIELIACKNSLVKRSLNTQLLATYVKEGSIGQLAQKISSSNRIVSF